MYRLHIDIPLNADQAESIARADKLMRHIKNMMDVDKLMNPGDMIQYRVLDDTDRNPNNYLLINENNHCSTKKCKISF